MKIERARCLVPAILVVAFAMAQPTRPRARDLGLAPGVYAPGPLNAITDVAGVRVGHVTLIDGRRRLHRRHCYWSLRPPRRPTQVLMYLNGDRRLRGRELVSRGTAQCHGSTAGRNATDCYRATLIAGV